MTSLGRVGIWMAVLVALASVFYATTIHEQVTSAEDDSDFDWYHQTISPGRCFSETYQEARDKFRAAAKRVGAELHSLEIVAGDYTTDVAILRGNQPGLVFHSSGVHGIEGYAGSAIQLAWMNHYHHNHNLLPTIVLVHAVNPYGMAHYRRVNEHNVDLNRNALFPHQWPTALDRDHNIASYQDFDHMFNPDRLPRSMWYEIVKAVVRYGIPKLKRALVTGQYHAPHGISYGGNQLEPSWEKLVAFLQETIPSLLPDGNNGKDTKATWIDVHTGLGEYGVDTIMHLDDGLSPLLLQDVFGGSSFPGLSKHGDKVKQGYESTIGSSDAFLGTLLGETMRDVWVVVQEFGTQPGVLVGRSLIVDNIIHQRHPEQKEWGQDLQRQAFYIRKESWRREILARGIRVLHQSIARVTS